jgi:K+-sensing histidine kinase KdpD
MDTDPLWGTAPWGPALVGYLASFAMTALAAVVAVGVDRVVAIPNLSLIFVLPVIIAGIGFGLGASLFSAVLGALAFNFFLTEPRYSLVVDDPSNIWAIALLFIVGLTVSGIAFAARRRAIDAALFRKQANALQTYSRDVLAADNEEAILSVTSQALAALFEVPAVAMLMTEGKVVSISKVSTAELAEPDLEAARSSLVGGSGTRAGVYPDLASRFDFWPVATAKGQNALIGLVFDPDERPASPDRTVDVVTNILALALDRQQFRDRGDSSLAR